MNSWSCVLILLTAFSRTSNGIVLHTNPLPKCNCIPLKECQPHILLNHQPHETATINKIVQNANCGYGGLDPLVCCPPTHINHKIKELTHRAMESDDIAAGAPLRRSHWPCDDDDEKKLSFNFEMPHALSSSPSVGERSNKIDAKVIYDESDIFDFKDPAEKGNFPHSFYEETVEYCDDNDDHNDVKNGNSPDKFFHHHNHDDDNVYENKEEGEEYYKKLITRPPTHNYPHDFSAHGFHPYNAHRVVPQYDYHHDKHIGIGNDHTHSHSTFGPLNDGIFVYPDDKRLHPSTTAATTTTTTTRKPTTIPKEESKKNSNNCGLPEVDVSTGDRIYPWIARIAYMNKTNNVISYRCSGSVVNESYILTAAHCVINLAKNLQLSHVRIGGIAPNCTTNANADCKIAARTYQIAEMRVHPNYDQPKYSNDIALLKIVGKANEFTPICLPAQLNASVRDELIGSTGIALGWTTDVEDHNQGSNPTVRYLSLPIVNSTECAITYAKYSENFEDVIIITPSQLCAQGGPMNDVCPGDSGGPLMDEGTSGLLNSNGRHTLLGIVAFGPTKCGMSNIPGVYTLVSSYLEWISDII